MKIVFFSVFLFQIKLFLLKKLKEKWLCKRTQENKGGKEITLGTDYFPSIIKNSGGAGSTSSVMVNKLRLANLHKFDSH